MQKISCGECNALNSVKREYCWVCGKKLEYKEDVLENSKEKDEVLETLTNYYDFILSNKNLSFISLSMRKDIEYGLCDSQLKLLLLKTINNTN